MDSRKTQGRIKLYMERAKQQLERGNINNAVRALEMVELIKAGKI